MYFVIVVAFAVVAPIGAALWEAQSAAGADILALFGKWTAFFGVGVRLFMAGVSQAFRPDYTLNEIFGVDAPDVRPVVQELGFANLSMGVLGLLALIHPMLTLAAATVGAIFYGLAGARHLPGARGNAKRLAAAGTDIWVFIVLAAYVAARLGGG